MHELRERMAAFGASVLSDAEVVALIIGANADPELGRRVLDAVGTPHGLLTRRLRELSRIPGVGPQRAQRLMAALELGRRAANAVDPGKALMTASDVAECMGRLRTEPVEVFVAIGVNARNRVTGEWEVARGWESGVNLTPRQVFTLLVKESARLHRRIPHLQRLPDGMEGPHYLVRWLLLLCLGRFPGLRPHGGLP